MFYKTKCCNLTTNGSKHVLHLWCWF